ncbi:MAG: carbohydrate ABC transporter permease [Ruminococcus sp.]|nr:carbohydrate ABC transporter permease [Ruminococcus sp.]
MNNAVYDIAGRQNKFALTTHRIVSYIVLILLACICLFPFVYLAVYTTRSHSAIQQSFSLIPSNYFLKNFMSVISDPTRNILRGMLNSLIVAVFATFLSVYFAGFTAYGIHVYDFHGKKAAYTFILLIMMVPTQVSALGFVDMIYNMGLMSTFWPLIIPAIAAPAIMFFMKQYMEASLPLEIVEAARIDGCNEFMIFNRIITPILKPAFAVQAIFAFVANWNNYFLPQLILDKPETQTLPVLIQQLRAADYSQFDMGKLYMFIALSILPVVIVYLILSKFIIRGVTLGAVKG